MTINRAQIPSRSKYRNVRTIVAGKRFASQAEAMRYLALRAMEIAGEITHLQTQVAFSLLVNGVSVGDYIADFTYYMAGSGAFVVEDKKGMRTPIYRLKKKLMKAVHGIDIVES